MLVKSALLSLKEQPRVFSPHLLSLAAVLFSLSPHYRHPLKVHVPFGNHRFLQPFVGMSWFTAFAFTLGTFCLSCQFHKQREVFESCCCLPFRLVQISLSLTSSHQNFHTCIVRPDISSGWSFSFESLMLCSVFKVQGSLLMLPHPPAN